MGKRRDARKARLKARKEKRANRKQDRKNALAGRKGWDRFSAAIGYRSKNFTENQKENINDAAQTVKESRVVQGITNTIEARFRRRRVRIRKATNGQLVVYPESQLPELAAKPNIGICFSGGGTRSAVASFGVMRAIRHLGHEKKLRYTSAVSGGSWFSIPYTFLPSKFSDNEFFGDYLAPNQISNDSMGAYNGLLNNAKSSKFCVAASNNAFWNRVFGGAVVDRAVDKAFKKRLIGTSSAEMNWSRAAGYAYLKPFDLYESQRINSAHTFFTWSDQTKKEALSACKYLEDLDFVKVERDRPFSIAGGSLFSPPLMLTVANNSISGDKELRGAAQLEMTPWYSGVTTSHNRIGGGVLDSYGIDGHVDKVASEYQVLLKTGPKNERFTLSDMLGICSSAIGFLNLSIPILGTKVGINSFTPEIKSWNFSSPKEKLRLNAIDGGYLENCGIMPLLRRKVDKIILCFNGGKSFHKKKVLPGSIRHLFGDPLGWSDTNKTESLGRNKNHVLENDAGQLEELINGLAANHAAKDVSFHRGVYQVKANANYGVTPYQVEILWFILDESKTWTNAINPLINGDETPLHKHKNLIWGETSRSSLHRFPNFNTKRLNFHPVETALLANQTDWCFRTIANDLEDFFE